MNIFIRADASLKIGSGHVMRGLTLAESLREKGASITFVSRKHKGNVNHLISKKGFNVIELDQPELNKKRNEDIYSDWLGVSEIQDAADTIDAIGNLNPDWLIVDHYSLGEKWEKELRPVVKSLFVIDDIANRQHDCDMLLDQNWFENMDTRYDELTSPGCVKLLGPKFALLRPEFAEARQTLKPRDGTIKRVFVFFGGSDPQNLTSMTLRALLEPELSHLKADVVIGSNNPHKDEILKLTKACDNINLHIQVNNMASIMAKADLAIGAGGVNTWERMCLGIPSIVIGFADNHEILLKDLIKNSYVNYLGGIVDIDVDSFKKKMLSILKNPSLMENQRKHGFKIVGHNGRNLVSEKIIKTNLAISILSDENSWINAFIPEFIIDVKNINYYISWVHKADDVPQGDICILLGCSQIMKENIRARNNNNIVVHESALPVGRGWSPLTWQIIEGKDSIPITLFEAADKMDSGDIYLQENMLFDGHELIDEMRNVQAQFSFNLCLKFIKDYPIILNNAKKQKGPSTLYERRTPTNSQLDMNKTLLEQFDLLRVVDNDKYPAYFQKDDHSYTLKIEKLI
jgi:UDP-2,4-diacetamido-2,4,6-trideoxy-beta-L-altropyranose hydrolase